MSHKATGVSLIKLRCIKCTFFCVFKKGKIAQIGHKIHEHIVTLSVICLEYQSNVLYRWRLSKAFFVNNPSYCANICPFPTICVPHIISNNYTRGFRYAFTSNTEGEEFPYVIILFTNKDFGLATINTKHQLTNYIHAH